MMLFDLATDPCEQTDVAVEHPDIVKLMRENMDKSHSEPEVSTFVF
jgi:hypothetical protein